MAKRKDVLFALQDDDQETVSQQIENYHEIDDPIEESKPQDAGEFVIFKLVKSNKKGGGKYPDGIDDIPDPRTGKKGKTRIRLLGGVATIFQDEQKDIDKDYVRQNRRGLHFPARKSVMQVHSTDLALLEFARKTSLNTDNPYHRKSDLNFYEYSPAKVAERALQKELKEIEVARKAEAQPELAMRKHAYFLGITATDSYGLPKPESRIRAEYIVAAKRDPERYERTVNSSEVEVNYLVRKALSEGFIETKGTNLNWSSGGFIGRVPSGQTAIDYLVELALLKNEDGKSFLQQLQAIV